LTDLAEATMDSHLDDKFCHVTDLQSLCLSTGNSVSSWSFDARKALQIGLRSTSDDSSDEDDGVEEMEDQMKTRIPYPLNTNAKAESDLAKFEKCEEEFWLSTSVSEEDNSGWDCGLDHPMDPTGAEEFSSDSAISTPILTPPSSTTSLAHLSESSKSANHLPGIWKSEYDISQPHFGGRTGAGSDINQALDITNPPRSTPSNWSPEAEFRDAKARFWRRRRKSVALDPAKNEPAGLFIKRGRPAELYLTIDPLRGGGVDERRGSWWSYVKQCLPSHGTSSTESADVERGDLSDLLRMMED
jgi:hypothetical protein